MRAAGDQRRQRRPQGGHCALLPGLQLAALAEAHFARNLLAMVPKGSQDMVAAALRSVFVQGEAQAVEQQWDQVIAMLMEKFPAAAGLMEQAREDFMPGPSQNRFLFNHS